MRILYVSTISATINAFLIPHIHLLLDMGHTVDMACNVKDPIDATLLERGCRVFPMSFQRSPLKKSNYAAYQSLKQLIIEGKYDCVHTHTPVASTVTRLACRNMQDVKVIYTAHGFHFFEGAPRKNWLIYYPVEKWLSGYTDLLITMNSEDYGQAKKRFHAKAGRFVKGVGVNLDKYVVPSENEKQKLRQEYGFAPEDFILVYPAELSYRKHQDLLIEAMVGVAKNIPNSKLLLVGDGPSEEDYRQLISERQLENHIALMGYRKDVAKLLMLSDVAVSSSRQEGLPVNVMEAMATGLPLVVSNCRGNRDLVKDGRNGYVITGDSPETYAEKIGQLYNDANVREKMKHANLTDIQHYSTESVLKEMEIIYKELLV